MPTTIADLAQFARLTAQGYRARADQILDEYRHERATEMESDCHDHWARIRFADGSEVVVFDGKIRPNNRYAIDWSAPDAAEQAAEMTLSLRRHEDRADCRL